MCDEGATQPRLGSRYASRPLRVREDVHVALLERFAPEHLRGVLALCEAGGWPSFPADPARALRVLTAPGVTTVVAVEDGTVVGFAQVFSDGELQAFLATLAVAASQRGKGVARALVLEAARLAGGERVDLLSEDDAVAFYETFPHRRWRVRGTADSGADLPVNKVRTDPAIGAALWCRAVRGTIRHHAWVSPQADIPYHAPSETR